MNNKIIFGNSLELLKSFLLSVQRGEYELDNLELEENFKLFYFFFGNRFKDNYGLEEILIDDQSSAEDFWLRLEIR